MAGNETMRTIGQVIDRLYEGRDEIGRDEMFSRLEAEHLPPEIMTYFQHLPDGDYTIDELADEISVEANEAQDTGGLGLLD